MAEPQELDQLSRLSEAVDRRREAVELAAAESDLLDLRVLLDRTEMMAMTDNQERTALLVKTVAPRQLQLQSLARPARLVHLDPPEALDRKDLPARLVPQERLPRAPVRAHRDHQARPARLDSQDNQVIQDSQEAPDKSPMCPVNLDRQDLPARQDSPVNQVPQAAPEPHRRVPLVLPEMLDLQVLPETPAGQVAQEMLVPMEEREDATTAHRRALRPDIRWISSSSIQNFIEIVIIKSIVFTKLWSSKG